MLLIIVVFSSCKNKGEDITNTKVAFIDSAFYHYEPRITRAQKYILADTTKPGGLLREYVSIDSMLLLIQDKTWNDSGEYYYSAFLIENKIAMIDMRFIKRNKLGWVNKGYYENNKLIHLEIQEKDQGSPNLLLDHFNSAAEIWFPSRGKTLLFRRSNKK